MKKNILILLCLFWGASFGALARLEIVSAMRHTAFPLGILLANMLGSFLLGFYYSKKRENMYTTIVFATACLGSLTTFSTFVHDIFLISLGRILPFVHASEPLRAYIAQHPFSELNLSHALLNLGLNIVLCLVCVYLGKKRIFFL